LSNLGTLPPDLPCPRDDGACGHLAGLPIPQVRLPSTAGREIDLGALGSGRTVIYCYPRTGVPGEGLPDGWDTIPGARGCTPEACAFRDHQSELAALGVTVFGLSTQDTAYERELVERLHLPFEILSDAGFQLTDTLRLPTFEVYGMRLIRRLTLVVRGGIVEHVFYPVFPPDAHAQEVVRWLERQVKA
jgi:peroxiredoxin